jgi:LuxR family quorum sensing-dependent transcriptional regulator
VSGIVSTVTGTLGGTVNVGAPFNYRDEALEFAETAEQADNADDVVARMRQVLGRFGLPYIGIAMLPHTPRAFDDLMLVQVAPPAWPELYSSRQFIKTDPVIERLRGAVMPFAWHVSDFDETAPAAGREVMERRADLGITGGFCVPVARRQGLAFVLMSGERPQLDSHSKPLLHLVAIYAFDRIRDLIKPSKPGVAITAREREVLTWIAAGKSAWEIGEILSIAKRTVDEHAQTVARKLGAVNRTQAVAIALRDRLIAI